MLYIVVVPLIVVGDGARLVFVVKLYFQVKIVMPNTSAGMVIGKAGANIKDIRDSFGCQIQV